MIKQQTLWVKRVCIAYTFLLFLTPSLQYGCQAWAKESRADVIKSKAGIVLCSDSGTVLFSQNANTRFTPASTLKVITSLCARHYLGRDYRFKTDFFLDSDTNLKIRGYGDPLFTSELIVQACHQLSAILKSMRISELNDIIVDNTFFSSEIKIDGTASSNNPYDAFVGPTSANFNTVAFTYSQNRGEYASAEPQTPLLPFVLKRVQSSGLNGGRVILSEQESRTYAGMLINHFLAQEEGVRIKGIVRTGVVTERDRPLYSWISPYDMDEIITRLLKYSSNFMANQLFLSAGAKALSSPATVEKGVAAMRAYAQSKLGISGAVFAEGSGLSRENQISPASMINALKRFETDYQLMQSEKMPDGSSEYYKTGTLNGVRTRCGYFRRAGGELYPFVIMVNEAGVGYERIRQFLWKIASEHER